MKKSLLSVLCCMTAGGLLNGQIATPEKEAPPGGVMLARAPDFARWNTTVKRQEPAHTKPTGDSGKASQQKPEQIVYAFTKTGSVYLQEYTDMLGQKWTTWTAEKLAATVWPGTGTIILQCNIPGLLPPDYSKTDFMGVSWVAESNFVKTAAYQGKKCLIFSIASTVADNRTSSPEEQKQPPVPVVNPSSGGSETLPPVLGSSVHSTHQVVKTAIIDFDTRVPVYAQDDTMTYTFEYLPPPTGMLQVPEEIRKVAKQQAEVNADITRPVPRAY